MKRLIIIVFIQTLTVVSAQNSFNNNEFDYDSVPAFKECSDKTSRLALYNILFSFRSPSFFPLLRISIKTD